MIVPSTTDYNAERVITGIAGKAGFSVITIEKDMMNAELGFGRKVLEVLEDNEISFEHLPSGIDTMCVVVSTATIADKKEKLLATMQRRVRPDTITITDGIALLAVVGRGMVKAKGTAARVLNAASKAGVNIRMIDQGSSELNIIIGIDEADLKKAHVAIYNEFVK